MIYAIFRALGIASWVGCVLALIYQSLTWVFTADWPHLSVMDITSDILGVDTSSMVANLPFQTAMKTTYLFMTTELSLGMWYMGALFLAAAFTAKMISGK